jgi:hypothetical protein
MIEIDRKQYTLLLSQNPCEIFSYLRVPNIHGLNFADCLIHENSTKNAYIAGWCNYFPDSDKFFVFINLSRCTSDLETTLLLNHELFHAAMIVFNWNIDKEEQIVTWAENETKQVYQIVNKYRE